VVWGASDQKNRGSTWLACLRVELGLDRANLCRYCPRHPDNRWISRILRLCRLRPFNDVARPRHSFRL